MIFAKPADGFKWKESENAQTQIKEICADLPEILPYLEALKERLRHTGHREGTRTDMLRDRNAFIYGADLDDLPSIQILYTILGETLTVQSVRVKHKQ